MPDAATRPARAVLMVHGAGGGGWEWNIWARVFTAAGWSVRAPDLEPSAEGLVATRLAHYQAQVSAQLAALPRPRALVGASLGGLLALRCADAADALVLVNPLPPQPWHTMLPVPRTSDAIEAWGARANLAGTRRAVPDAGTGAAWHAFRRWRDESGAVIAQARAGVECAVPSCLVLVLAADADVEVPVEACKSIAAWCGGEARTLEGGSHVGALMGRHAAAIAADVVTWLNVKTA
ncbi:MAG: alpha/beta hydrolase [Arenimonas sp.]